MNVFCLLLCHIKLPERILTWNPFFCLFWSWLVLVEKEIHLTHPPQLRRRRSAPPCHQDSGFCHQDSGLAVAPQAFTPLPKYFPQKNVLLEVVTQHDCPKVRSLAQEHRNTHRLTMISSLRLKCSCKHGWKFFTCHFQIYLETVSGVILNLEKSILFNTTFEKHQGFYTYNPSTNKVKKLNSEKSHTRAIPFPVFTLLPEKESFKVHLSFSPVQLYHR